MGPQLAPTDSQVRRPQPPLLLDVELELEVEAWVELPPEELVLEPLSPTVPVVPVEEEPPVLPVTGEPQLQAETEPSKSPRQAVATGDKRIIRS
jgi:hypothetical protein